LKCFRIRASLEYYERLGQPLDERVFIGKLREELEFELASLNKALPKLRWVEIAERPAGAIKLTPLEALPERRNLRRLKAAIVRRWGTVPLIDMLKEAVLRTGCLRAFSSVGAREAIDRDSLEQRLILLIYAYGTNTGIRAVAAGEHGHREEDLRYARRRFLTVEAARQVAASLRTPPSPPVSIGLGRGLYGSRL
jgi:hypothetical protein